MGALEQIPCVDFSSEALFSDEKSESWKELSKKAREACEKHGCFLVHYNKNEIPKEAIFKEMVGLFDLDEETKKKHVGTGRLNRYSRSPFSTVHQSFGIDEANRFHVARDFTDLMWPNGGNPNLCEALNSMSSKMLELSLIILNMVFKSFGCEVEKEIISSNFRVIKYDVSPTEDPTVGLIPHTDKNFITILCQNEVQGLEIMSKDGFWRQIMVPNGQFMVIVGDSLKAWSNGRLDAAKHRVMMRGEKVRYSCGLFLTPKEEAKVEVPHNLVDENHPLRYRSFIYSEFFDFFKSNLSVDALELFAGVC